MIVEETGNVCTFYDGTDCSDMCHDEYKNAIKNLNGNYLRMINLLNRPTGEEIVDLINYVFSDFESCIVCKCKIESIKGKLYYTVYGKAWQDWHTVWDSMIKFARKENNKKWSIARKLKELESNNVDLKLIIVGDVVKKPIEGRYGFIKSNDYFDFPEEQVFKIKFSYDDMYCWIKETAEEYLRTAKENLTDYYHAEGY